MVSIKNILKLAGTRDTRQKVGDVSGLDKYDVLLDIHWVAKNIETTRRLNMIVFLLQEKSPEIKKILNYTFYDTIVGPYSPKLTDDVEDLANGGWIRGDDKVARGEGFGHSFMLSDFGIVDFKFHKTTREKLKNSGIEGKIREVIEKYNILKKHPYNLMKEIKQSEVYKVVRPAEELHLFS